MAGVSGAQALLQRTFTPMIGSLTSPSVELICRKNNVSFAELLRPFSNVYVDHKLKDPSGNDLPIKHLKVGVQDVNEQPPSALVARRLLNEAVANASCDVTREVQTSGFTLDIPIECPWYHAWTETFLQVQYPSEHEFLRHLLGCMLVTSTQDPPETMQALQESLRQLQIPAPSKLPKWFCPAIFKFYVVVHDAKSGDKTAAMTFFESIKVAYGADNCYFLEINSRQPEENLVHNLWADLNPKSVTVPEDGEVLNKEALPTALNAPHPLSPLENHNPITNDSFHSTEDAVTTRKECGTHLSTRDLDSLRELMVLLVRNALMPHVEKQIYILGDLVANKKGVSRSLLSATKRLFGSPRPGLNSPGANTSQTFSPDATELQIRRLGDMYFLFSSYHNAFQAYYTAKRELGLEQAWLYYAGALEMAALSAFMSPEPSKKALEYIEEAITTYQSSCQMPQFATRATILSIECLKEKEMFSEAAKQLIRMTSEDSDLRSALLLEQAAYCVLRDSKPRKYAFHLVLAGYRYNKAGQKKHALRCVRQALQVYDGRGWDLAEDHIHTTIGRLSGQLSMGNDSDPSLLGGGLQALTKLLHSQSRQAAEQQAIYLHDYLNMHQAWERGNPSKQLSLLPLPVVEENSACVQVVAAGLENRTFHPEGQGAVAIWAKLEEMALGETIGAPMVFKPTVVVFNKTTSNAVGPVLAANERLEVQVGLKNPLQISLPLSYLRLLWKWTGRDGREVDGCEGRPEEEAVVHTDMLTSLLLPPLAVHHVTLGIVPKQSGVIDIYGVACSLTTAVASSGGTASEQAAPVVRGRQDLIVRGPKLRPTKEKPYCDNYAPDKRLRATVVPSAPMLTVSGIGGSIEMVCGQTEELPIQLTNRGAVTMTSIAVITDCPSAVQFPPDLVTSSRIVKPADSIAEYQIVTLNLSCAGGGLSAGAQLKLGLWLRAAPLKGPTLVHLLFLYTGTPKDEIKHRVVRSTLRIVSSDGPQITAVASRSSKDGGDSSSLCITVCNRHSETAVIRQLALASKRWSIRGPALCPKDLALGCDETMHVVAKAVQSNDQGNEASLSTVSLSGDSALNDAATSLLLRRAACQLMVLGVFWETSIEGRTRKGLSIVELEKFDALSSSAPTPSIPLTTDSAHAPKSLVIFGPDREKAAPARREFDVQLVSLSISHSDLVGHQFNTNRICLIPVTVNITNSNPTDVSVEINPLGQASPSSLVPSHLYVPHASSAFTWAAKARARVTVPARGRACVSLQAAVVQPGTYDLAVRLSAAVATSTGPVPLPAAQESPLVVVDVGS